jgi:hypothetical protein
MILPSMCQFDIFIEASTRLNLPVDRESGPAAVTYMPEPVICFCPDFGSYFFAAAAARQGEGAGAPVLSRLQLTM